MGTFPIIYQHNEDHNKDVTNYRHIAPPKPSVISSDVVEMDRKVTCHDPAQPKLLSGAGLRCHIQFKSQQCYPLALGAAGKEEGAASVCFSPGKSCTRSKPARLLSCTEVTEQSQFFTLNNGWRGRGHQPYITVARSRPFISRTNERNLEYSYKLT